MILIFSTTKDSTTFEVIKWLHHFGAHDIVRINADEKKTVLFQVHNDSFTLQIEGQVIEFSQIRAVWYRKGIDWLGGQFHDVAIHGHPRLTAYLNKKARQENQKLAEYIHYVIEQRIPVLGSAFKSDLNKMIVLDMAHSVGLPVPEFYVLNEKHGIEHLLHSDTSYITKSMSDGVYLFESEDKRQGYFTYTESLTKESLAHSPEHLSPSLLQHQIEKQYEVRVFYLDGQWFAWAIFSQADAQTRTDYRKYNDHKPNRVVPYVLPATLTHKLAALFHQLELNTGSVDLIVDRQQTYYFLEINPVGQFSALSHVTNYQLEAKVARWLIDHAQH